MRGAFPDVHVTLAGASALPDDSPGSDLVTKVLCTKHDAELASLDVALVDLVNCIREIERLRAVRSKVSKNWPPCHFIVDGLGIERCVLKMVMNHAAAQRPGSDGWQLPAWLPDAIFGARALKPNCGLAVVARIGDVIIDSERIGLTLGRSRRSAGLESAILELRQGLRLLCSWDTAVHSLGDLRLQGDHYAAASDTLWHPRRVSFSNGALDLGISLDFDWSGKWTASKHPAVSALRAKFAPPPQN
jgi:hypothetical protein